jgi:hypothetical protein
LQRGRQRLGDKTVGGFAVLLGLSILFGSVFVWKAFDRGGSEIDIDAPLEYVGLALILFGTIGSFLAVPWLLPGLQLLSPGEPTRLRRFRLAVMAFVSSLIVSIVATVIYEAVT